MKKALLIGIAVAIVGLAACNNLSEPGNSPSAAAIADNVATRTTQAAETAATAAKQTLGEDTVNNAVTRAAEAADVAAATAKQTLGDDIVDNAVNHITEVADALENTAEILEEAETAAEQILGDDIVDNAGSRTALAAAATVKQVGIVLDGLSELNPTGGEIPTASLASTSADKEDTPALDAEEAKADPESPHGSEVQAAYAMMTYYAQEGNVSNDEFVMAAKELKDAWTPAFEQAFDDYNELISRIRIAKSTAEEYFQQQSDLTAEVNREDFRKELELKDQLEREVFEKWAFKADKIATAAYEMMRDMEDVDIFIAKTNLSAHFAALQSSTSTLPASMEQLHLQLDEFREATRELNDTFGYDISTEDA